MVRSALDEEEAEFFVINAGVNSECAWNLQQRLDDILACDPDIVTIMIGTNDWKGIYNEKWARESQQSQHLPQAPTKQFFEDSLRAILSALGGRRPNNARDE